MSKPIGFCLKTYKGGTGADEDYGPPEVFVRIESPGSEHIRVLLGVDPYKAPEQDQLCPDLRIERQEGKWSIFIHQDDGDPTCEIVIPDGPHLPVTAEACTTIARQKFDPEKGKVEFHR